MMITAIMPASRWRRRLAGNPGVAVLLLVVATIGVVLVASSSLSAVIYNANDNEPNDNETGQHHPRLQYNIRHLVEQQLTRSRHHKKLLPLDSSDYLGFFFSTVGLMIAAGGGIGGGGVLVPIYILVMKFTPKYAIPLSNVTVFGGAVANTVLNMSKRHPLADRPLVDWDLILVMEPLTIAGALLGAFLNKLLPEAILVISLVALLSFTAYETLKKAIRMYRAETHAMHAAQNNGSELTRLARALDKEELDKEEECQVTALLDNDNDDDDDDDDDDEEEKIDVEEEMKEEAKLSTHPSSSSSQHQQSSSSSSNNSRITIKATPPRFSSAVELQNEEDLYKILQEERHVPTRNVQILCLTLGIIIFINLIKGGGSSFPSPLGITCGSIPFWIANGLMILWTIIVILFARDYLIRRYKLKARVNYPYVEGDIAWDHRATIIYPVICTAAGFFAGMFGVGGGIVTGPLMLAMGVHPKVSSATNAVMILFTSFPVTTSFIVFGLLDMEYAGVCLVLGFVATLIGQWGLFYLMQKYQRNSYIAFSIGGIVLLSAFLMTIQSLLSMADSGGPRPPAGLCTTN
jgi:uncharacterized membrane protein YfcA